MTLFGQSLYDGKFFLADEFGHRVPVKIWEFNQEMDPLRAPLGCLHRTDIKATILDPYFFVRNKTYDRIERVIFNDPATIIIWEDGTKTIVKCQEGDTYSKELGLAMCFAKKFLGNKGNFNDIFKKYLKEEN